MDYLFLALALWNKLVIRKRLTRMFMELLTTRRRWLKLFRIRDQTEKVLKNNFLNIIGLDMNKSGKEMKYQK